MTGTEIFYLNRSAFKNEINLFSIKIQLYELKNYNTNPVTRTFTYVVRGNSGYVTLTLYGGVKNYLTEFHSFVEELQYLNDELQYEYLKEIVKKIKEIAPIEDNQVRIAISLVQNIPYDYEKFGKTDYKSRFPYEVLYENKGVCGEKSRLLAFILRELGYGVVYFEFKTENHRAIGIKCPLEYSYKNTGYCFIETARPTIPTYSESEYIGVGKLTSIPEIIKISDGKSFDSIWEEYKDAQEWSLLVSKKYLNMFEYSRWKYLVNKYGIEVGG